MLSTYTPSVSASLAPAQYSVSVTEGSVYVSINLNMIQNLTSFKPSFILPLFHASAAGTNSSGLARMVQDSLQLKNPHAQVSNLNFQVGSSRWFNATSRQWLNMSLSFDVSGVSVRKGDVANVDLSWKSFVASSAYSLGGVEVNRVGEKYLLAVATDLAAQSGNSQFIHLFYQVNGVNYPSSQFPVAVGNLFALNFSGFTTPVSKWTHSPSPLASAGSESWSFSGGKGLGMMFIEQVLEAGSTTTAAYGLLYDLTGTIIAPSNSRVDGDTLILVVSELSTAVMGVVVLSTVGLLFGSSLFERRILSRVLKRKPKR